VAGANGQKRTLSLGALSGSGQRIDAHTVKFGSLAEAKNILELHAAIHEPVPAQSLGAAAARQMADPWATEYEVIRPGDRAARAEKLIQSLPEATGPPEPQGSRPFLLKSNGRTEGELVGRGTWGEKRPEMLLSFSRIKSTDLEAFIAERIPNLYEPGPGKPPFGYEFQFNRDGASWNVTAAGGPHGWTATIRKTEGKKTEWLGKNGLWYEKPNALTEIPFEAPLKKDGASVTEGASSQGPPEAGAPLDKRERGHSHQNAGVVNPLPENGLFARVMSTKQTERFLAGKVKFSSQPETFITALDDIKGHDGNSTLLAERLTLAAAADGKNLRPGTDTVIVFRQAKEAIQSPIEKPEGRKWGFKGQGTTRGGAREWVIKSGTIQELRAQGLEIDHIYSVDAKGVKTKWELAANPDGTLSVLSKEPVALETKNTPNSRNSSNGTSSRQFPTSPLETPLSDAVNAASSGQEALSAPTTLKSTAKSLWARPAGDSPTPKSERPRPQSLGAAAARDFGLSPTNPEALESYLPQKLKYSEGPNGFDPQLLNENARQLDLDGYTRAGKILGQKLERSAQATPEELNEAAGRMLQKIFEAQDRRNVTRKTPQGPLLQIESPALGRAAVFKGRDLIGFSDKLITVAHQEAVTAKPTRVKGGVENFKADPAGGKGDLRPGGSPAGGAAAGALALVAGAATSFQGGEDEDRKRAIASAKVPPTAEAAKVTKTVTVTPDPAAVKAQEPTPAVTAAPVETPGRLAGLWRATKAQAGELYDGAKQKAADAYDAVKTKVTDTYDAAKTKVTETTQAAKNKVVEVYQDTKTKVVETAQAAKAKAVDAAAVLTLKKPIIDDPVAAQGLALATDTKSKFQINVGLFNALLSGDSKDVQVPYSFRGQKYAVVTINGMDNDEKDARLFNRGVREVFGVTQAAYIANYSHGPGGLGDKLQTLGYEAFGAVDAPAINAALAMKVGIREKGEVHVVAHSQGSEIFNQALKLLTSEERRHVHYQGFGSETYIDEDRLGLAEARNVRNQDDAVPFLGNGGKFTSAVLQTVVTRSPAAITRTLAGRLDQAWERVDTDGAHPRMADNALHKDYVQKNPTENRHNFIKYYFPYVVPPREKYR
jgi:hypothetical protein